MPTVGGRSAVSISSAGPYSDAGVKQPRADRRDAVATVPFRLTGAMRQRFALPAIYISALLTFPRQYISLIVQESTVSVLRADARADDTCGKIEILNGGVHTLSSRVAGVPSAASVSRVAVSQLRFLKHRLIASSTS